LEAIDLVERLLKLNPRERLGAGKPGSPNDLQQLVKHPYFKNINFSNL
jgi:3-phosphoinositide dependent protein kinase-1